MNAWKKIAMLAVLATVAMGAAIRAKDCSAIDARLDARARRIFEYDRKHQNALSPTLVRSLSVALSFHDHEGAAAIVHRLESHLN